LVRFLHSIQLAMDFVGIMVFRGTLIERPLVFQYVFNVGIVLKHAVHSGLCRVRLRRLKKHTALRDSFSPNPEFVFIPSFVLFWGVFLVV